MSSITGELCTHYTRTLLRRHLGMERATYNSPVVSRIKRVPIHIYNVYTSISPLLQKARNKPAIFICTGVLRRPAIARVGTLGARRKQQSGSDPIHLARRSSSGAPSSSAGRRASHTGTWPARPPGTSWRPAPARRPTRPWRSPSRSPPLPRFSKNQNMSATAVISSSSSSSDDRRRRLGAQRDACCVR